MFCNKCGEQVVDGAIFCVNCGNKLPEPEQKEPVRDPYPVLNAIPVNRPVEPDADEYDEGDEDEYEYEDTTLELQRKNKGLVIGLVFVVIALVVALAIVAILLLRDNFGDKGPDKSDKKITSAQKEDAETSTESTAASDAESSKDKEKDKDKNKEEAGGIEVESESEEKERTEDPAEDQYIIPTSSTVLLTADDIKDMTAEELRMARNEIFARYGRRFDDKELQAYFDGCDWYKGDKAPDEVTEATLNEIEKANVRLLREREEELK